jgi:hypothetical protein
VNDKEFCNLVEVFPTKCDNLDDFKRTLKFAYLYGKTITLTTSSCVQTNREMLKNRRVGVSLSGIQQFLSKHTLEEFRVWCDEGYKTLRYYDDVYSEWLAIPRSIKITTIKPSGTLSLLASATSGMHFPESRFCIRRINLDKNSELIPCLVKAGYHLEPSVYDNRSMIVEVPVYFGQVRTLDSVSIWEQFSMCAFLQRWWSDNQVSCTVTFKKEEQKDIVPALNHFQYHLKGISLLPRIEDKSVYAQIPYEKISEEKYNSMIANIKPINFNGNDNIDAVIERFCDSESCLFVRRS